MNQQLFDREVGSLGPHAFERIQTSKLIYATQSAPTVRFDGGEVEIARDESTSGRSAIWAHQSGVNALVVDRFDGRFMISGGADSSIKLWDLEQGVTPKNKTQVYKPVGQIAKQAAHKFGITKLSFYSFDAEAFLSSSYDHTLKIYATETQALASSFNLDSVVYSHDMSPIAQHLLVACATQHPAVRLIDLRSGSSAHSLVGHHGALLSVSWSPAKEYILASGGIDGTVRLWDIRKAAANLGSLDMENSTGIIDRNKDGKAHSGAMNGLTWTDDGEYIVSAGHDQRVRVWNAANGANTLASFGPTLKNSQLSTLPLLIPPSNMTPPAKHLLYYPNDAEILQFDMHEGRLLKRLKGTGPVTAAVRSRTGERNIRNRITALAWRVGDYGVYSAHTDGQIRGWLPRTNDDEIGNEEEAEPVSEDGENREAMMRKRKVLDDIFKDLTKSKITFT